MQQGHTRLRERPEATTSKNPSMYVLRRRSIRTALACLILCGIVSGSAWAQQATVGASSLADASWMQYLAPNSSMELTDLPEGSEVVVRVVQGGETIAEQRHAAEAGASVAVEVAMLLVDSYNAPCDAVPAALIGLRSIGDATRVSTTARCLDTRPRSVIPIRLDLAALESRTFPIDTWIPLLAFEATPQEPPIDATESVIAFYVIASTWEDLPPLPTPSAPASLDRLLREVLGGN